VANGLPAAERISGWVVSGWGSRLQEELLENWELCRQQQPLKKIEGL